MQQIQLKSESDEDLSFGERVRREHGRWLARALEHPESVPRIPVRRVDEGGFSLIMQSPHGRNWARHWWNAAFASPGLDLSS